MDTTGHIPGQPKPGALATGQGYDEAHAREAQHAHHHHTHHGRALPDMSHIQGWGADLDRKNRPAVPMERTPPRLDVQPLPLKRQPQSVEVLVSPEHLDGRTPVFGSTVPPRGLSGWLRRQAFQMT